tara:strand:+ start:784 stop:2583 length:1800 start_codon:yes stop_codon:yes gene_type:complete
MGFSLGDLGSFAVGAIKQDEKNTAEKLVDRRAELQADRAMHIKMKEQKYERDIKAFDEENKKFKAIQSVNAEFKDMGEISPAKYGERYLSETNPTLLYQYKTLYKDNPNKLNEWLSGYGNESLKNFKTTNTIDSLDANRKTSIDEITALYKTKLEEARGDSFLINKILGDRKKAIATVETVSQDGENGIILANEINKDEENKDDMGFSFGELKPVAMGVPEKWKKDSNIQVLRKDLKKDISNINKKSVNTTLRVMTDLNIPLPKQLFVYEKGQTKGPVVGFKKAGKTVNNHLVRLDNQAIDFLTNEYVYGKETDASNVSTYFSAVETENAVTTRLRDYSSELSTSQTKGFWKNRQNVVAFVPFSVVGLDNDFRYNEDGSGQILDISDRKTVGAVYYNTLKKIATDNDPKFENATEADSINKLQDRLLKLKPGEKNDLLTKVKKEMATTLGLDEPKEKPIDKAPDNIVTKEVETIIVDGKSIPLNEKNIKYLDSVNYDWQNAEKVKTKKTETNSQEPVAIVPQETDEGYDSEYNTARDRSITAGNIRRLKRGVTLPMTQKERLEARRIQEDFRKKQKKLLEDKKRNEALGLPEIQPLKSE